MTKFNKRTTSHHRVRFADCDPMGHLYNARYLDYFMHAREDQLRENYDFVEMLMFDKEQTHVKSVLWVTFIHIDTFQKKVVPHGEELNRIFEPLLDALTETNFDHRSMFLRKWTSDVVIP